MKHAQREGGATLRRQPIDGLLDETAALIAQKSYFRRLTLSLDEPFIGAYKSVALHQPSMANLVRREITSGRKEKRPRRDDRVAFAVGPKIRFLNDLFGCFARAHEAPDISKQRRATLVEKLDEGVGGRF